MTAKWSLLEEANNVVACWDDPSLAMEPAIEALRIAVSEAETYTPMTDDEHLEVWQSNNDDEVRNSYERYIERAVIERLGLRWPE